MRTCKICGYEIPAESRARKCCSEACRRRAKYNTDRAWLQAHPGKAVEYSKKWREANPDRALKIARDAYRKKCVAQLELEKEAAADG